uniref:Endonuclease 8-like 3 n=1 Tax=Salarias fasciatus TaxID=181472 RepID=A0A672HZG7_SALFA
MVEGPGCTLNGEKLRSRVKKGQKVKEIRGGGLKTTNDAFRCFLGCQFTHVQTLGKELFMYFGPRALRIHFGMNGSLRINAAERRDRTGSAPVLEIRLTDDTVRFFDSTVEIRLTEDCEQRVEATESLDLCSSRFSASRCERAVRSQGGRMLCDVLLDQAVMPGVGNIIKNEALFDSGLHPAVKVRQLTDEQIRHVVKMTRDFTLLFYKCRKSGSPLHKHFKVYKRPRCGRCSHATTACRLGDNGRMTYLCESCQSGDPSTLDVSKLPVRNPLIGWAGGGSGADAAVAREEEEDWACRLCTLVNRPAASACDACLTPRPAGEPNTPPSHSDAAAPSSTPLIRYPCNAFRKPPEAPRVNWRSAFGTSTLVLSDLSEKPKPINPLPLSSADSRSNSLAAERGLYNYGVCQGTTSPNSASGGESPASCGQPSKKMRMDHSPAPSSGAADGGLHSRSAAPRCASHRRPAVLRVVHKDGENKGRRFYACSLPTGTRCNFFEWADLHFPLCHHGRRCLMRTVLKLGPNNGRNFYTCGSARGKQCGFFQWAADGPGV